MNWQLFRVTYELMSPLHIGYHKAVNVQSTRYYVPARNLWAAVTVRLMRSELVPTNIPRDNYLQVGEWVKQHCAFSYLFLLDGDTLLYPRYENAGLRYGKLSEPEFERRFLSAHVTTALDAATRSAEDGSLHEVEFIAPHDHSGRRTQVSGFVWLDEVAMNLMGEDKWRTSLGELQIGGERRYGFGRLRSIDNGWKSTDKLLDDYETTLDQMRPRIKVKKDLPLLAHTLTANVQARGMIEPLVGRETRGDSQSFGQTLTSAQVCWVPGSIVLQEVTLQLENDGIWKAVDST